MKKFISIISALCMLCSLTMVSYADQTKGKLSLNAEYWTNDWGEELTEVKQSGDYVDVYVNASSICDMTLVGTKCDELSGVNFVLTYDPKAVKPKEYATTDFKAVYTGKNKNIPSETEEGIIATGAPSCVSNLDDASFDYTKGRATMVINGGTLGFVINGDFMCFTFEVIDPSKSGDIGLTYNDGDYFDTSAGKITPAEVKGISLAGMGTPVVEDKADVATYAVDSKIAPSGSVTFGISGEVKVTGTASFNRITFNLKDGEKPGKYDWDIVDAEGNPVSISAPSTTFGLNIKGCPVGANITVDSIEASLVSAE